MSQYGGEDNPHLLPRQPWDHHPTDQIPQSERIQPRTRPHSQSPTSVARPAMGPPEYDHLRPPPERHPDRHSAGSVYQPKPKPSRQHRSSQHGPLGPPNENLMYPEPSRTRPITWCGAVFCVILWLVVIFGGLLVLIIYLVYRPQTPRFEIPTASLNAIYLDSGYLLNVDLTVVVNFTNPSKKVNVNFRYVTLQLYFEKQLIGNQYIEPFSAFSAENKVANVEIVSSRVRLGMAVTQEVVAQIQRNRINFEVDGIFHGTSNFGSLLRYSYWLYGHCNIEMTGPPSGIMVSSKCHTKD